MRWEGMDENMAETSDKTPMTREKLARELQAEAEVLRGFATLAQSLLSDVTSTINRGDVTFATLEQTKKLLEQMTEYKTSVSKVRAALKARMGQRTKEV